MQSNKVPQYEKYAHKIPLISCTLLQVLMFQEIIARRISSKSTWRPWDMKICSNEDRWPGHHQGMASMCRLKRNCTYYFGKRMCTTALYQSGIDQQNIMGKMGHRLEMGVLAYKRSNADITCKVSKLNVWIHPRDNVRR